MIRIYDTAQRRKVELEPHAPGRLGIYVCGPTVYDYSHVGHARCYVAFDAIVRHLRQSGLAVTYVRNLTDVDDKIIKRAAELGEEPLALSARFSQAFHQDMRRLGALEPDVEPKVSDHIDEIVAMIVRLVEKEHAYVVDGDVFFDVDSFDAYGGLSGRNLDELRAGERVDVDTRKRNPFDFALWKTAKPGEPAWDSPWGQGRPGWHIECSAMSGRYLGQSFDIHGGGMDLIFPHHENEIAQSHGCYGGKTFARYWMHNGFINIRNEKMSKSLGNFFTIREVLKQHEPEALRMYLLGTHYRKPICFEIDERADHSDEQPAVVFPGVDEAERRLAYMYTTCARLSDQLVAGKAVDDEGEVVSPADTFLERFTQALDDDFNTAAALGHLAELFSMANKLLDQPKSAPKAVRRRTLQRIQALFTEHVAPELGLLAEQPRTFLDRRRLKLCACREIEPRTVAELIAKRREARQQKDFTAADALRDQLVTLGIELMDRPDGQTDWVVREELPAD